MATSLKAESPYRREMNARSKRLDHGARQISKELQHVANSLRARVESGCPRDFREELLRIAAWLNQQAANHPLEIESPRLVDARIAAVRHKKGMLVVSAAERVNLVVEVYDSGDLVKTKKFYDPRPAFIERYNANPNRDGIAFMPVDGGLEFVDMDAKGGER